MTHKELPSAAVCLLPGSRQVAVAFVVGRGLSPLSLKSLLRGRCNPAQRTGCKTGERTGVCGLELHTQP